MRAIEFLIQGSAPDPYRVSFVRDGNNLNAFCTCPAGENGQYCKHRIALLSGDTTGITTQDVGLVDIVRDWLRGTDLEIALTEFVEAEKAYTGTKARLTAAKRKLAEAMRR